MAEVYKATSKQIKSTNSEIEVYNATPKQEKSEKAKQDINRQLFDTAVSLGVDIFPKYEAGSAIKQSIATGKPVAPGQIMNEQMSGENYNKYLTDEIKKATDSSIKAYEESKEKEQSLKSQFIWTEYLYKLYEPTISDVKGKTEKELQAQQDKVDSQLKMYGYDNFATLKAVYERTKSDYNKIKSYNYYVSLPAGEFDSTVKDKEYANVNAGEGLYSTLTKHEVGVYNHLYKTEGKKSAKEYLSFIKENLEERKHIERVNNLKEFSQKNLVTGMVSSALSVPMNFISAGEQLLNMASYVITSPAAAPSIADIKLPGAKIKQNKTSDYTGALRGGMAEQIDIEIAEWDAFDFAYNAGMSAIDSVLASTVPYAGELVLGLSAAASTTNDILSRGGSGSQAFFGGLAAGFFEYIMEKLSLDELRSFKAKDIKNGTDIIINLSKLMGVNFLEETATEFANITYDYFANEGISEYSQLVTQYYNEAINKGMTPEEAEKQAKEQARDAMSYRIIEAGASGALSALFMGGGKSASMYKNTSSLGKIIASNGMENHVINAALNMGEKSASYQMAQQIQNSGNMSTVSVGSLAGTMLNEINNTKSKTINEAIYSRLIQAGASGDVASQVAKYYSKAATQEKISKSEIAQMKNNEFAGLIANDMNSNAQWVVEMKQRLYSTETIEKQVLSALAVNKSKTPVLQSSANGENSSLQSSADGGIISQGGEDNGQTSNQGTVYGGVEETAGSRGKNEIRQSGATVDEYVAGGKAEILSRASSDGRRLVRVNYGKSNVAFTKGKAEDTPGYKVYTAFKNAGMKVIYCEGAIERTVNGKVISRTEAFTAPDGTVYVSSESKLPPKQTFDHEKVHVADKTNNPAYTEYEAVLCDEVDYFSDAFQRIAKDINKFQFDNKYDIDDISSYPVFMREIAAYINQFVLSDPAYAQNTFGGMFGDWNAVVEAVNKFNTDMKADFTESASFMPENDSGELQQDRSVQPAGVSGNPLGVNGNNAGVSGNPSGASGTKSGANGSAFGATGQNSGVRHHTTKAEQEQIKRVCAALGVKMKFIHITTKLMAEYGYNFTEDTLPDGFFNESEDTLYIGFSGKDPIKFVFKHELTHFSEGTEEYTNFVKAVKKTKAFNEWLAKTTNSNPDEISWAAMEGKARQIYIDHYSKFVKNFGPENAEREMIADFVGKYLFSNDVNAIERIVTDLKPRERNAVYQYILDFLSYLKKKLSGEKNLVFEISRLEDHYNRMLSEAARTKKATEQSGDNLIFSIINLDSGKSYVQAARKIITGNSVAEWRSQISKFFNDSLKNGPIQIQTVEGDILTISKDTADKARDKHITENGITRELTDKEFFVKLNAEAHIDELAEISHRNKAKVTPDVKSHSFAKDGFTYRTVYFQDFDGAYYRITLSVGENSGVSTVYNVGKIKADDIPNGNIVSAIGSKADMSSANSRISQSNLTVKNNISSESDNYTDGKLQFTISRALDNEKIKRAEEIESESKDYPAWAPLDRLKIWEETGLVRDPSGVWVYEIDDGKMKFFPNGDRFKSSKHKPRKNYLKNYVRHTELFKRYPQLNQTEFALMNLKEGTRGTYLPFMNAIVLDRAFYEQGDLKEICETLVHEMQHAAQYFDDRENGSSIEFWNQRLKFGPFPKNPRTGKAYTPIEAYYATQGEYEARMAAERLWQSSKDKKDRDGIPYLGNEKVISANKEAAKMNGSLQFSIPTDREYLNAVESGDNKALQQMVDEKAKASGYTERLFHQTGAEFTEFNTDNQKAGKYDWELPTGMFLKPSNDDIGLKGKKQMELYAKQQNSLEFSDRAEAQQYWRDNVEGYTSAADEILRIDAEYRMKSDAADYEVQSYMKRWRSENPNASRQAIYNDARFQELHDKEALIFEEWEAANDKASLAAKKLIDDYIAQSDYDGVVLENDIGAMGLQTKTYIVFDSSQLKDASPITYDDSGKVIPLSQRFDESKKDIRFSVPRGPVEENQNADGIIDNYTEEQYNNFGWVRVNDVLSASEYSTLLSRYADYKHNGDKYPTTRFGEAVIYSTECPNVIMYAKGEIDNPIITKVVRINYSNVSEIKEEILHNERRHLSLPYESIGNFYGQEILTIDKARSYESFREVKARIERERGKAGDTNSGTSENGTRSVQQNKGTDRAGLKELAFSIPQQAVENLEKFKRGEITQEEYLKQIDELYGQANADFGILPQGENTKTPYPVPKAVADDKPTRRWTRTFIETGKLTDEMLQGIEEKILLGDLAYEAISDKAATHKAVVAVNNGTAEDIGNETVNNSIFIGKNQIAIGEQLLVEAMKSKDTKRTLELVAELSDVFTRGGQLVQAARLLKQMTGAGRLVSLQRVVKTLNKDLQQKYGENAKMIKIDATLAEQLVNSVTSREIEMVYQNILSDVASQAPVTWIDKWNAWRYFAMLSNPKTHIQNVVGNAIFVPAVRIKNVIALGMEHAAVKTGLLDESNMTKSLIIKKEYVDFAKKDGKRNEVVQLLKGNKYNDKTVIKEKQRIFKNNALEFLTTFNSNALEAEDMLFKNKHYIHALSSFLQAKNVDLGNVSEDMLTDARTYAVNEARKATFNDESALANWIQKFGNKNLGTHLAVEGVLPFKRTPINVVKRGIEYSPIGLATTLTKGVFDIKKGKITPTEFIDGLASGLTGSGIMLVGMLLASMGCITGGEEDDDLSEFEKLLGKQEYAVQILGNSYTIDWAAPACIPFFIGVEIVNTVSEGEDFSISKIGNVVWNSLEPITNLSMLSGIQGVIESARYAKPNQILASIAGDALTSYAMQAVPSLAGVLSRTIDPTQRSWYTDKNDKVLDSFSQSVINNVKSKIPGLSYTQIPKIDAWGREVSRGNAGERIFENFISPGYYSKIEYDEVDEELKRIFVKTGAKVFPKTAAKSFQVDGETKQLTADEYVIYAKAKGEYSFEYICEFVNGSAYKSLSDAERADVIENLYKFANAKAKTTVSDYDLTESFKTVTNRERNGGSAVDYYIYQAIKKDID